MVRARLQNILFAVLLPVMLLVLFVSFLRYSWEAEKDHKIRELTSLLQFAGEFSEGYLVRVKAAQRKFGLELVQREGLVSTDQAIALLNRYKNMNPDQKRFSLCSASGEVIADTGALETARPLGFSETPILQFLPRTKHDGDLEFERINAESSGENVILPLSYSIHDTDGALKYILHSRLQLSLLQNFWKTALVPQESILGLVHDEGYLISRYSANPGESLATAFGTASTDALASHLQFAAFPTSGTLEIGEGKEGSNQLVVYRRLTYHPVTMFASIPISSIRTGWWGRIKAPLVLLFALLGAGASACWLLVTKRQAELRFIRKRAQLRDVAQRILVAQEQERARISHELHDEIGQSLTALKITINRAAQSIVPQQGAQELLRTGTQMVEGMIAGVRSIAYQLRPGELDQLGLTAALRSHLDKTISPLLPNVALLENVGDRRFSPALELCCFRVAQEALTNCLRHSEASQIKVSLNVRDARLTLSIADNGRGFDAHRYLSYQEGRPGSLGLLGMRERILANRGYFSIRAAPGKGCVVSATFELAATEEA